MLSLHYFWMPQVSVCLSSVHFFKYHQRHVTNKVQLHAAIRDGFVQSSGLQLASQKIWIIFILFPNVIFFCFNSS